MRLSIITVNKNNKHGLSRTLDSVCIQTFTDWEHIVIDGLSTDGSSELINDYNRHRIIPLIEPDNGIYEAMNKGIALAQGDFCLFLNSGDVLCERDSLEEVAPFINKYDLVYTDILLKQENGLKEYRYPDQITIDYILRYVIPHQASLIRRSLFNRIGQYNTNFKIVSDWLWTVKLFTSMNIQYYHSTSTLTVYDTTGLSFNEANIEFISQEREKALRTLFSDTMLDYLLKGQDMPVEPVIKRLWNKIRCSLG